MKPSSMQLHVSPPQNALSCTAYSLHFSRLSHSAASSSFCWMYRVPYWSLEKGKAGHASVASCLWLSMYLFFSSWFRLHLSERTLLSNSYQLSIQPFRAESRIIPAPLALANSPTRFSWPMQVAWLHCEQTRQNANDIQTMQFCDHLESPCLGAWSTSSSGTSLICLRTCRDEVRGAIRNLWKPLGFWNQFRSLFCPFWEKTVAPGWAVHSRCHRLQELQLVPPVWTEGWQVVAGPAGSPWQMIAGVPDRTRQSRAFTDFHFLDWLNLVYPVFHF